MNNNNYNNNNVLKSCSKLNIIRGGGGADPQSESRSSSVYVPRDEAFSELKQLTFSAKTLKSVLKALVPSIQTALVDTKLGFPFFTAIDSLFNEGLTLPKPKEPAGVFKLLLPRLVKAIADSGNEILLFEAPEMIESKIKMIHISHFITPPPSYLSHSLLLYV